MIPYNVNTDEYVNGAEFAEVVEFISNIKQQRKQAVLTRYPEHVINSRQPTNDDVAYYPRARNVPHYDILVENFLHQGTNGYIELNEYTYQLNVFFKAMFHRKIWTDALNVNPDAFMYFVYDHWKTNFAGFEHLETNALRIFNQSETLLDYFKDFLYNEDYYFFTLADVRELFDQLVEKKLLISGHGDLYQIYQGLSLDEADTDMKTIYHSGRLTEMDKTYINATFKVKLLPALRSLTTQFRIVPESDDTPFNGVWLCHKFKNTIQFIPQYLLFCG